jgi:hypothetical protein
VIGSIILAVVVGVLSSLIVWIVLKTFKRNRGLRA